MHKIAEPAAAARRLCDDHLVGALMKLCSCCTMSLANAEVFSSTPFLSDHPRGRLSAAAQKLGILAIEGNFLGEPGLAFLHISFQV